MHYISLAILSRLSQILSLLLAQIDLSSAWLAQLVKALATLTHVRSSVQEARV